ncbi:PREDICTED: heavy metal-associated isoprenylated plant protein 20-like [Camelina sativa]|uniref:Heavy metal-associated isoprenylated plant protein 20-like n=1 Tax=Camelina sativa TaxID=90675 RepID=A0ABM0ZIQ6_CAMSA|nr:PREDICTED: heavy metal-associated isoprenylated plant protein 20-like [Camelina sativa]
MLDWIHGNSRLPIALSIVELLVDMDCQGCERKVRRAISKLDGVDTVEIDVDRQKVTVTGYVDREDVLKMVKRTGRTAEFWPFPYNGYYGDYYTYPSQHLEQSDQKIYHQPENTISYSGKYDYYDNSPSINGYYPRPSQKAQPTIDENALHLFSDDNVQACIVM